MSICASAQAAKFVSARLAVAITYKQMPKKAAQTLVARRRAGVRAVGAQSTTDHLATEIRRALIRGDLAPGAEFSMADLSEELGVSHIPVREALRRLEAQGMVSLRPGRSAVVTSIDGEDVADIYHLWILLCEDVAERACKAYTDADLKASRAALEEFAALPQDSEEAFERHCDFHMSLLEPGSSSWDRLLLETLWLPMERAVRLAYSGMDNLAGSRNTRLFAYESHLPLLEAAESRDAKRLRAELRRHHESHKGLVIEAIDAAFPSPHQN
jgi:DNA-binding GntR family transcriptional regulator